MRVWSAESTRNGRAWFSYGCIFYKNLVDDSFHAKVWGRRGGKRVSKYWSNYRTLLRENSGFLSKIVMYTFMRVIQFLVMRDHQRASVCKRVRVRVRTRARAPECLFTPRWWADECQTFHFKDVAFMKYWIDVQFCWIDILFCWIDLLFWIEVLFCWIDLLFCQKLSFNVSALFLKHGDLGKKSRQFFTFFKPEFDLVCKGI